MGADDPKSIMSEVNVFSFVTSGISKSSSPGISEAVAVVVVVVVVVVALVVVRDVCGDVVDASLYILSN